MRKETNMCDACYVRMRMSALARERDKLREAIPQWVSVNVMHPEPFIPILLYLPDAAPFPTVREGYYAHGEYFTSVFCDGVEVTHWCEMPGGPKDG